MGNVFIVPSFRKMNSSRVPESEFLRSTLEEAQTPKGRQRSRPFAIILDESFSLHPAVRPLRERPPS